MDLNFTMHNFNLFSFLEAEVQMNYSVMCTFQELFILNPSYLWEKASMLGKRQESIPKFGITSSISKEIRKKHNQTI